MPASLRSARRQPGLSRRAFLGALGKTGAAFAAAPLILPRNVLGGPGFRAPSDTVNVACVGVGGMGKVNLANMNDVAITGLCDVDLDFTAPAFETWPKAARYQDYRRMFDEISDDIDGVVIATPDHTHALITLAAMERGIHVYTQKPLTWSVWEARQLGLAAQRYNVITQMGNQGRSSNELYDIAEHVKGGTIGEVGEVHVWTNRPIWPQGMGLPSVLKRKPDGIDWDLYLGPAADMAYDPAFHPFVWRGWVPFGTGALGDIAAHSFAFVATALDLGAPTTVETRSSAFNGHSYPVASTTFFEFPAHGERGPVRLTWYDGGFKPPRPEGLSDGEWLNSNGMMYVGSKGTLLHMDGVRPDARRSCGKHPSPTVRPHRGREPRKQLGARDPGRRKRLIALRFRRPPHRDGAARRRLAPCGQQKDSLGCGKPPHYEPAGSQPVSAPYAAERLGTPRRRRGVIPANRTRSTYP